MALVFERIFTEGIALVSYMVGDDSAGVAAVIDPRADVDVYLKLAQKNGVVITHVFETHIHADFVSGARTLAEQAGAKGVFASVEGDAEYQFEVNPIRDGDEFVIGETVITVRHTPGHTPEHVAYEVREKDKDAPWGVFSGDSLFVASAGRPDLLGAGAEELASQLYDTLFDYYASLAPGVLLFPGHGAGSPCGADIGDRMESSIGYEMEHNPYYQIKDRKAFVQHALDSAPPEPTYYKRMKRVNAGEEDIGTSQPVALTLETFRDLMDGHLLIDTRDVMAFGGAHIPGAMHIGASPMLTIWAGWLVKPDDKLLLVLDDDKQIEQMSALFLRAGFTGIAGYLAGGMSTWNKQGLPVERVGQMSAREVHEQSLQIVDVRTPEEWANGHVPGAKHLFLGKFDHAADKLDTDKPTVTYCASGYRASIGASLLKRQGIKDVRVMAGSWSAWTSQDLPVESSDE